MLHLHPNSKTASSAVEVGEDSYHVYYVQQCTPTTTAWIVVCFCQPLTGGQRVQRFKTNFLHVHVGWRLYNSSTLDSRVTSITNSRPHRRRTCSEYTLMDFRSFASFANTPTTATRSQSAQRKQHPSRTLSSSPGEYKRLVIAPSSCRATVVVGHAEHSAGVVACSSINHQRCSTKAR